MADDSSRHEARAVSCRICLARSPRTPSTRVATTQLPAVLDHTAATFTASVTSAAVATKVSTTTGQAAAAVAQPPRAFATATALATTHATTLTSTASHTQHRG